MRHVMPGHWPPWAKLRKTDKADHLGTFGATYGAFNGKELLATVYPNSRGWAWVSEIEKGVGGGGGWSDYETRGDALWDVATYLNTIDPGV